MKRFSCFGNVYMVPDSKTSEAEQALIEGNRHAVVGYVVACRRAGISRTVRYTGDMAQWVERLTLRRQRLAEDFKIKQEADR